MKVLRCTDERSTKLLAAHTISYDVVGGGYKFVK